MNDPLAVRRNVLGQADDPRVTATRRRLIAAFKSGDPAAPASLTVAGICGRAGVGRSTFYTHFATLHELAAAAVAEDFAQVGPIDLSRRLELGMTLLESARGALVELVDDVARVVALAPASGDDNISAVTHHQLVANFAELARPAVETLKPAATQATIDLTCIYIAAGFAHAMSFWAQHPELDQETIVDELLDLLPRFLTEGD